MKKMKKNEKIEKKREKKRKKKEESKSKIRKGRLRFEWGLSELKTCKRRLG